MIDDWKRSPCCMKSARAKCQSSGHVQRDRRTGGKIRHHPFGNNPCVYTMALLQKLWLLQMQSKSGWCCHMTHAPAAFSVVVFLLFHPWSHLCSSDSLLGIHGIVYLGGGCTYKDLDTGAPIALNYIWIFWLFECMRMGKGNHIIYNCLFTKTGNLIDQCK